MVNKIIQIKVFQVTHGPRPRPRPPLSILLLLYPHVPTFGCQQSQKIKSVACDWQNCRSPCGTDPKNYVVDFTGCPIVSEFNSPRVFLFVLICCRGKRAWGVGGGAPIRELRVFSLVVVVPESWLRRITGLLFHTWEGGCVDCHFLFLGEESSWGKWEWMKEGRNRVEHVNCVLCMY